MTISQNLQRNNTLLTATEEKTLYHISLHKSAEGH